MKTRDELAEAILLASVATDPTTERTRMMSPEAAYRQAAAFVAERERRAGKIENRVGHDAPTETAALKFDKKGDLLNAHGNVMDAIFCGESAFAVEGLAQVRIRVTDRAHAERIVAAMLPVGRATK